MSNSPARRRLVALEPQAPVERLGWVSGPLGPISALIKDDRVTDILINGPDDVWIDRGSGLLKTRFRFRSSAELRAVAQRLATTCGRRLDDASPCVDARLADGTRLHAVLPPVARGGPYVSLRLFRHRSFRLDEITSPDVAQLLAAIITARLTFLITGNTGSGKTTLLNVLLGEVAATERIVLVEDSAELCPKHPHVVALETKNSNVEGSGAISLRDLVRQALRMRPDRIIVGECRGSEVADLLAALNTGHDGSAGTVHANDPADIPARMEALALTAGMDRPALHAQLASALQVIVHIRRQGPERVVDEVCVLRRESNGLVVVATAWHRVHGPGPAAEQLTALLTSRGVIGAAGLLAGSTR